MGDHTSNELATPVANAVTPYPSDYTKCNTDCSVMGDVVTVIVDNIGGDDTYSDTPKTYNDLPGRPPEGNAWVYMITQEPDRGENYEVTSHGGFQPQSGSLDNQYVGVKSVGPNGRTRFTWQVTMINPTCSPGDGAIEYQLFYPPHYAPAGQISNPEYRITTISPWGTNVWER